MRRSFNIFIGHYILLARSNLRRTKGQTAAILVLMLLAAVMFHLWLMLSMDYKQNFARSHEKQNAEHVTLAISDDSVQMKEFLQKTVLDDERTTDFSIDSAMQMVGLFQYNGGEINSDLIFLRKQTAVSRSVGKVELTEESACKSGVYMPILYKSDDIAVGNKINIMIGNHEETYTICGFFNSIMGGSHNCGMCEIILTEDKYKELQETGYAPKALLLSVRLKDKSESENFETMLKNEISSRYPSIRKSSNSYAIVEKARYISQMICSGIISVMAFFILLIALVVIASNIVNYIQENMKNLGALKAIGFTSRQLIGFLMLQFAGLSLIASAAGICISYVIFPFINKMMIAQTGIPYQIHFLLLPFVITLSVLGGMTAFFVWLSARRIKKLEPVTALRQGIRTHNFKTNHVPLDKTKAPLSAALASKTAFFGITQSITICITMFVLSLAVVFSGLMSENVIVDMTSFLDMIVGETADSCINVNAEIESDFLEHMQKDEQVEKIYLYNSIAVSHVDGMELIATVCDDFSKINNQNIVFEGRFPKYENEIAIGAKYAKEREMKVGDEITITANGREAVYLITGYTQLSNNFGRDCLLTRDGYERIGKLQNASYYMNLSEGTDIDAFHTEADRQFGTDINATINILSTINAVSGVYISLITIIVIALLILSLAVIAFVLFLLVRTMLNKKKRDYGIMKGLGFTTKQLILQTALSFMPSVILSTSLGLFISSMIINPLMALFLNGIGIVKCMFAVPAGFVVAAGIGMILSAFLMACLMSLRVRKIVPRELLAGE